MSQLPNRAAAAQAKLDVSASTGIRASLRSVIISVALGAVKVISGVVGHSYALIADGVESMLDVFSGAIVAGSLKIAAQPPDEKYPFGYGKVEPAAALVISRPCWPRRSASRSKASARFTRRIMRRRRSRSSCSLLVVVIKELLFRFLMRTGESIDSNAMRTDAWHHRSDSLTSVAAFIGISIALIGGEGYEPADDWAALFAACVIFVQRRAAAAQSLARNHGCVASGASRRRDSRNRPPCRGRRRHRYVPRPQERLGHVGRYSRRGSAAT